MFQGKVHDVRQTTPLRLAAQTLASGGGAFSFYFGFMVDATLMAIISNEGGFGEDQTRLVLKTLAGLHSSVKCCRPTY